MARYSRRSVRISGSCTTAAISARCRRRPQRNGPSMACSMLPNCTTSGPSDRRWRDRRRSSTMVWAPRDASRPSLRTRRATASTRPLGGGGGPALRRIRSTCWTSNVRGSSASSDPALVTSTTSAPWAAIAAQR